MKSKKKELNKKLLLNKKSIAALNTSEMGAVQGGLPQSYLNNHCPVSYLGIGCHGGGYPTLTPCP